MSALTKNRKTTAFVKGLGMLLFDSTLALLAMMSAVRWRYDFLNKPIEANIDHVAGWVAFCSTLLVWIFMRQTKAIWRFTSLSDFRKLLLGVIFVALLVPLVLFLFVDRGAHFPRSAPFTGGALFFALIVVSRLLTMIVQNGDFRALLRSPARMGKKALLIGPAPDLYNYLRDRSRRSEGVGFNPVGLIETSDGYKGRSIRSVPVLGGIKDLADIYPKISAQMEEKLQLISVNSAPGREETAALLKTASNLSAPLARDAMGLGGKLNAFEASDLIGRDMQMLDLEPVRRLIEGRRVLITGAGGSIGSELAEQIAALAPAKMILLDHSEYNLFQLEHMIRVFMPIGYGKLWQTYIADVTQPARMAEIFESEKPEIVLHAAALKHVPLGEENPLETLRTNVYGTKVVLEACKDNGVEHFILISTDKAVNPANVMGASKRIVEMMTLAFQSMTPGMQAAAVRFGNVLASRGSVVNLFEEQIAAGGPVTVTHPDVNRYFMMVEEASALVLQAAALGAQSCNIETKSCANIYVLEMGEPVNIRELARQLIRLRGKVPDVDIAVEYTGLRAGEKLTEVLSYENEPLTPTEVEGILRYNGEMADPASVLRRVDKLITALERRNKPAVRSALRSLLPDYEPNGTLEPKPKTKTKTKLKARNTSTSATTKRGSKTGSRLATPSKP